MKKLFAILLSLVMLLSLLPVTAMATVADPTVIDRVDISVAEPEAGKAAPEISIPADAKYSLAYGVYGTGWYEDYEWVKVDTIENGVYYCCDLYLKADEGYEFADPEDVKVFVNGVDATDDWDVYFGEFDMDDDPATPYVQCLNVYRWYDFTALNRVDISFTEPEAGKAAPEISIPADAPYSLLYGAYGTDWYEEDEWVKVDTIENGFYYCCDIYLKADEGYEFAAEDDVKVFVNGVDVTDDWNVYFDSYDLDDDPATPDVQCLNVWRWYDFVEEIDRVDLPAWPELQMGDTAPAVTPVIPDGALYAYAMSLADMNGDEATGALGAEVYAACMAVMPIDGCVFAEDVEVTIGGEPASVLFKLAYDDDVLLFFHFYDFDEEIEVIDKIELFAKKPVAGEEGGEVSVPADAGYVADYDWGVSDTDDIDDADSQTGSYLQGQYAWIAGTVVANEGQLIAPDAAIYVNGEKLHTEPGVNVYYDAEYMNVVQVFVKLGKVQEVNFADIPEDSWQLPFAVYAVKHSLMAGKGTDAYGNIKFDPNSPITREEFVQVLYNAEGKPAISIANPFPDVADGGWYKNAVLWAKQNDIASGKGNGNFGVGENISRQDLAMMLYKYAKLKGYSLAATEGLINGYADGDMVASYAKTAMDWAVSNGIMSGKGVAGQPLSTFRLDPTGIATRAECAAMLKNFRTAFGG